MEQVAVFSPATLDVAVGEFPFGPAVFYRQVTETELAHNCFSSTFSNRCLGVSLLNTSHFTGECLSVHTSPATHGNFHTASGSNFLGGGKCTFFSGAGFLSTLTPITRAPRCRSVDGDLLARAFRGIGFGSTSLSQLATCVVVYSSLLSTKFENPLPMSSG
jgi:hypothetical protein